MTLVMPLMVVKCGKCGEKFVNTKYLVLLGYSVEDFCWQLMIREPPRDLGMPNLLFKVTETVKKTSCT